MASLVTEKDILKSDDSSEEREVIPELLALRREQEKETWKSESDARQVATAVSGEAVENKRTWKSYIWSSTLWSWSYVSPWSIWLNLLPAGLDVSKEEAWMLTKLDLTLISSAALGVMIRYLDQ
jgi:ACS family pantothenate transporter-like MFS transporter